MNDIWEFYFLEKKNLARQKMEKWVKNLPKAMGKASQRRVNTEDFQLQSFDWPISLRALPEDGTTDTRRLSKKKERKNPKQRKKISTFSTMTHIKPVLFVLFTYTQKYLHKPWHIIYGLGGTGEARKVHTYDAETVTRQW